MNHRRQGFAALGVACVAAALLGLTACGGGGGNGAALFVLGASATDDRVLPQDHLYLDDRILILCSTDVDPASVTPETVEIVAVGEGTIPPDVTLAVDHDHIVIAPRLPSSDGFTDTGFQRDTDYRISVPGDLATSTIWSRGGRVLETRFTTTFRTRNDDPLLKDPVPGAPAVSALLIDLDEDGVLEGDGLRSTPEREEFFNFALLPVSYGVPTGRSSHPTLLGLLFSEPLLRASVFADSDGDGQPDRIRLFYDEGGDRILFTAALEQTFSAARDRWMSLLRIRARAPLRELASVTLALMPGLVDLGAPANELRPVQMTFQTGKAEPRVDDAIVESFATRDFLDPRSTALWDVGGSGRLVAGAGLGGDGSDGPFVATWPQMTIDADPNDGVFNFTSFVVPEDRVVVFRGTAPVRLFVRGDATIRGAVDLAGGNGAAAGDLGTVTPGGEGGPGGGGGGRGNPNGTNAPSDCGESGQSPPGVASDGECPVCGAPRSGGGCGGPRTRGSFAGGGGGGHGAPGEGSGGGIAYGDDAISVLQGGSGGGGGGNFSMDDFRFDSPGGGGGGGGGVIAFSVGGSLTIGGQGGVPAIDANGGRGGGGSRNGGSAGGGGGSGGAIKVQATQFVGGVASQLTCRGGPGGGSFVSGDEGSAGAVGRIRIETPDGQPNLEGALIDPAPSVASLSPEELFRTSGISLYYDTGAADPRYAFDGSDPATGALTPGSRAGDLDMPGGIPAGTSARIVFFGAREDAARPGFPDLGSERGPETDVGALASYRFIRFEVQFDAGSSGSTGGPLPSVESLRIRFHVQ